MPKNNLVVYMMFVFNRENYPSTTEYIDVFSTEEKAKAFFDANVSKYTGLKELYYEKKVVG